MNKEISQKVLSNLTLLLIEPNDLFRDKLTEALHLKIAKLVSTKSLDEAITLYNTTKIDIIMMEMIYKDDDPFIFIRALKKINNLIPIIVVTHKKEDEIFLNAIRTGIDDYILKPINIDLLKNALLNAAWKIYFNGLYEISFKNNTIYNIRQKKLFLIKDGYKEEIVITANESKLLDLLLYNKKILLTKDSISETIWENNFDISDEAFKSLLNRLRKKIGKDSIKNISGRGYMINI